MYSSSLRFPLVIQVFNNSDLTGLANVPLSGLLSEPKTTVRQPSGATGLRQTTALQVTVKGLTLTDVIGEITLNLSMEDFGPTQLNVRHEWVGAWGGSDVGWWVFREGVM